MTRRGRNEDKFLAPLEEVAATGTSFARKLLECAYSNWKGGILVLIYDVVCRCEPGSKNAGLVRKQVGPKGGSHFS